MAHVITFDTLAYANKLKAAGFENNQAETLARAQAELLSSLAVDQLATKQDVRHLENKMENKIKDLETKFDKLETKVDSLETRIIVKMGGMMIIAISILATLITILH